MAAPEDSLLLQLSQFVPSRPRASAETWRALSLLAPPHGVAPMIAYNVEYRLAGAGAPQPVRDVLLSHYQGALADSVFKFVNLKHALTALEGRQVMLLDAAIFADTLYPHVAFRPVGELRLLVHAQDLAAVVQGLGAFGLPQVPGEDPLGGTAVCSDDRTRMVLHTRLFSGAEAAEAELWSRALPSPAFGANARRPALEDALLSAVILQARQGFETPLIHLIDLRELVRGAPDLGGPYSHPPDVAAVQARAKAFRIERALWTAMETVAELFPEVAAQARALQPTLRPASQALLRKLVVAPLRDLHRQSAPRGLDRIRRLLAGG